MEHLEATQILLCFFPWPQCRGRFTQLALTSKRTKTTPTQLPSMQLELGLNFGTRFGTRLKTGSGSGTRIETWTQF